MKKVLYITNIEVPYKVRFFNGLSEKCDLTVLYERRTSANRNALWAGSEQKKFHVEYLDGCNIGEEYSFSLKILGFLRKKWDSIFISCYNSAVQMFAILAMSIRGIPFFISLDGEAFIDNTIKGLVKKFFLNKADGYMVAGYESGRCLSDFVGHDKHIYPYFFSSMSSEELNRRNNNISRENFVLVVGQFYDYKGMDLAFHVACKDKTIKYKFVGMGNRTDLFLERFGRMPENVEVIPFLQKMDLEKEYQKCAMLLLPTRQECWGLVVNEAASFGTPIVSTWGSGAAVEFIASEYPQYLAKVGDVDSIYSCVKKCLSACNNNEYSQYLIDKARKYSIEKMVEEHLKVIYKK